MGPCSRGGRHRSACGVPLPGLFPVLGRSPLPRTSPFGEFIDSPRPGQPWGRAAAEARTGSSRAGARHVGSGRQECPAPCYQSRPGSTGSRAQPGAQAALWSAPVHGHRAGSGRRSQPGHGGPVACSHRAPSRQPPSLPVSTQGLQGLIEPPHGIRGGSLCCPPSPPHGQSSPSLALGEGGSPRHNKAANVNGTLIPRQAALPAPDFPPR